MNIIIYSTGCPKCRVIEKKLQLLKLPYTKISNIEEMTRRGFKSAPMTEVDGQLYNFKEMCDWISQQAKLKNAN